MAIELIAGIGAAIGWGIFAWLGTLAARQMGGWITNMGATLASVALIVPIGLVAWPMRLADPTLADVALIGAAAAGVLVVDVLVFQLLAMAPVAIVYPIFASNSAVVTVLAVLFLGETLSPLQVLAVVLVACGIFLIAWRRGAAPAGVPSTGDGLRAGPGRSSRRAPDRASIGVVLAALGLTLLAGVVIFILAGRTKELGWYPPLVLERGLQGVLLVVVLAGGYPPRRHLRGHAPRWWWILGAMGLANTVASVFYGVGNQVGSTAITATVTSTFGIVPVILGIVILHERPQRHQLAGIVAALGGIVLLGAA
jgi:hypothetical protein